MGINCVKKLEGMWSFFFTIMQKKYLIFVEIGLVRNFIFFKRSKELYFRFEIKFIKCLIEKN